MFDDGSVVNHFIEAWRRSGQQRIGYLIGQYKEYHDVPLGIRAVVSAIYEPPQVKESAHFVNMPVEHSSSIIVTCKLLWPSKNFTVHKFLLSTAIVCAVR